MPVISPIIIFAVYFLANFIFNDISDNKDRGVLIIAPMIMNLGVVYPLIYLNFPDKFLTYIALFDLPNGILTLTLTYAIAIKYGSKKGKIKYSKIFSPPLIALIVGLIFNYLNVKLLFLNKLYEPVKYLLIFTIYFSLGSFFYFSRGYFKLIVKSNLIRFLTGFIIAIIFILFLNLNKSEAKILLLCSMAPCGFNTLTFSVLENLNVKLAASIISFSLLFYFLIAFTIIMF